MTSSSSASPAASRRQLLGLLATPLASIFGSGFLIIVPVVIAAMGANAPWGILVVCLYVWPVGAAVRESIVLIEGRDRHALSRVARLADSLASPAVILAYVVSVSLYLRVLSAYAMHALHVDSDRAECLLVSALIVGIVVIGVVRGFHGLERVEQWALYATLAIGAVLLAALAIYGVAHQNLIAGHTIAWPRLDAPSLQTLAVLGGVLITVQGFETVRFLGDEYPADIRIRASRWSQGISGFVYVALALVATPLMVALHVTPEGEALLELVRLTLPVLALPLVGIAVGSQLSASIADTVAAVDGAHSLVWVPMRKPALYILLGAAAIVLVWATTMYGLVTLASQAFALYYALTCIAVAATTPSFARRSGYGLLAVSLFAIAAFAQPAT